jgi:Transglycosylase SLT domain
MSLFPVGGLGTGGIQVPNTGLLGGINTQTLIAQPPTVSSSVVSPESVLPTLLMELIKVIMALVTGGAGAPPNVLAKAGNGGTPLPAGGPGNAKLTDGVPEGLQAFKTEIETAAEASGLPANLLAGMIWQESRGDLAAITVNGGNGLQDTGLMQVNPNTYKDMQTRHPELQGRDDLSDPQTNVLAGAFYMKEQIERFGSIELALRAYNSGPNGVDVNDPSATPAGTGDPTYVTKVMNFYRMIGAGETLPP